MSETPLTPPVEAPALPVTDPPAYPQPEVPVVDPDFDPSTRPNFPDVVREGDEDGEKYDGGPIPEGDEVVPADPEAFPAE